VDIQLAWLFPLLLVPLVHSPRAGLQLALLLLILSCCLPGVVTYLNNYPWAVDLVNDYFDAWAWNRDIYLPTHTQEYTIHRRHSFGLFHATYNTAKSLGIKTVDKAIDFFM
jgi:hypothetical protein